MRAIHSAGGDEYGTHRKTVGPTIGEDMTDPDVDEFSAGIHLSEK